MGFWNIQGLYEKVNGIKICKLNYPEFLNTLKKFDVLCLQETHISEDDKIPVISGYRSIPHCREMSKNNRYFGGFLVFIRKSIGKGVKINFKDKKWDVDAFGVTLQKGFFQLRQDIKILFTYASPLSSCYTQARDMNILDKIEESGEENDILMGDLNGWTKLGEDFVNDSNDKHSPINDSNLYLKDIYMGRENQDTQTYKTHRLTR